MKRRFRVLLFLAVVVLIALAAFFFYPAPLTAVAPSASLPSGAALVERGRYLATASDCMACHTAQGGKPYAGGLPFKLPFGTLYSSNITPDPKSGIGKWSAAEFVRAVRHGVAANGKELYPAMPYSAYTNMSNDDVLAIRAYLQTVPAVAENEPANQLAFPFNMPFLMRGWKLLNMPHTPLQQDPAKSMEWNRGAYLVEGPGHCAECHTPRNMLFGLSRGQSLAGAVTQGWKAYNITSDPHTGIGKWSVDEIARFLSTGHAPGKGAASGSMAEAVSLSLSHMTPSDIHAMAVYLKSVPPRAGDDQPSASEHVPALDRSTAYRPDVLPAKGADTHGLRVFEGVCASCHAWNGKGLATDYAALGGARTVSDPDAMNLLQVILHGSKIKTKMEAASMPAFGESLSDADIAAVSNYVLQHFGGQQATVTPERVAQARKEGGGH
jgi:mono/diheme cytochrome c family protein